MFWPLTAAVIGLAVLGYLQGKVTREKKEPGFKDLIKHPELLAHIAEGWDEKRQHAERLLEEARDWDDAKVEAEVRRYLFDVATFQDAMPQARALKSLGDRIHGPILAVLRDPSLRTRLTKPTSHELTPEAPFNRAWMLFHIQNDMSDIVFPFLNPPSLAAGLVVPFLDDPSEYIRADAARVLGAIASPEVVAPLRKALQDADEKVVGSALGGLRNALKAGRLSPETASELFDDVRAVVGRADALTSPQTILLGLERDGAVAFLTSEEHWASKPSIVARSLRALADAEVPMPRDRLRALVVALEAGGPANRGDYAVREALRQLGRHRHPDDLAFLQERAEGGDPNLPQNGSLGLLAFHGLEGFEDRLYATDREKLNESQSLLFAVERLNREIDNGGFAQYFFNSSGDDWPDALRGLKAMGFVERTRLLNEAVAAFGEEPPSTARDVRMKQLAELANRDDEATGRLDSRWYECDEDMDAKTTRFVLDHADDFR